MRPKPDKRRPKPTPAALPVVERNLTWLTALLAGVILLVLAWPVFSGRFYTYDDLQNSNLPMKFAYWSALHSGDSFLWAPQFYCGVYNHGESEVGMCHPLRLVLYKSLPMATAYGLEFVLTYVVLFFGTFYFLRHLKLEKPAALFGAMVFSFSGFNLWHFMHLAPMAVIAHVPWLLLTNDLILCSKDRRQRLSARLATLLLTTSQCLLGHPQFVLFSIIAESTFALIRFRQWASLWRAPDLIAAKALGAVVGAIQLLPLLDLVSTTNRSDSSYDFRMSFSMHPWNLTQLWSPLALLDRYYADWRWGNGNTHEMGLYSGAFCTVVIPWLAIRWKDLGSERRFLLIVTGLGLVALWLALGKYGGLYPVVSQLPGIKSLAFRAPTRFILLFHMSLALLAGFALADLTKVAKKGGNIALRHMWPLAVPLVLSVITFAVVAHIRGQPENRTAVLLGTTDDAFTGLLLIGATVALVGMALRGVRWAVYGIVGLTFFEIAVWGLRDHIIRRGPPKNVEEVIASMGQLPPKGGRLFYYQATSIPVLAGYNLMLGNIGLQPAKKLPVDLTSLRLADVRWALTQNGWGAVPDPMPRARLVSQVVVSENVTQAVQQINIAATAIVEKPVDFAPGEPGKAEITTDRPGHIEIKTTAPTRQFLVLSESFHSGWKARVDGAELPVVRAYGDYMGCVVDAGTKTVVFNFEPRSFSLGAKVSATGLGLALLWLLVGWFVKPKPPCQRSTTPDTSDVPAAKAR